MRKSHGFEHAIDPGHTVTEFNLGMALLSNGRALDGLAHVRHAVDAGVPIPGARYALLQTGHYMAVETPELLDYEGAELVLIGARKDVEAELGISLEMQEVDAVLTCKKNNLHEYVKKRAGTGTAKGTAP